MRSVSRMAKRIAPVVFLSVILAQSAAAATDDPKGPRGGFFSRVRQFIIHALDQMSVPTS